MSVRSDLPTQVGSLSVRRLSGAVIGVAACMFTGSVNAIAAEDAGAVLTKMAANYQKAQAYSASIVTKQAGKTKDGKSFTLTKNQVIKFKAPNLVNINVTFTGTGEAAGKVAQGDQQVVADGKILTAYSPARKIFMKKPDLPKVTVVDLLDILKRLPLAGGKNVSLLSPSSVAGHPVYVVEIRPMMPPNLAPDAQAKWKEAASKANPLHLMIDKKSYFLLRITESASAGSVDVTLNDQLFNGSIPASAFGFVPPPGAKEVQAPPMQGAAPGAPPRPGGPAPVAPRK